MHTAQCAFLVVRWPCSQNGPVSDTKRGGYSAKLREEGVDTGAYLGKKRWIQGHILREITDLEFGTHCFLMNHVFLPTEQVETNLC